jgi:hypothetical protein
LNSSAKKAKKKVEEYWEYLKRGEKCAAMEGIITEGEKLMKEDMSPEVSDAAIIAAAQKVEHYEISSYGTARAYAQELNLKKVEGLLKQTLEEEYEADDLLTELAESRINERAIAENGGSGLCAAKRTFGVASISKHRQDPSSQCDNSKSLFITRRVIPEQFFRKIRQRIR